MDATQGDDVESLCLDATQGDEIESLGVEEKLSLELTTDKYLGSGTSGSVRKVAAASAIDGRRYAVKSVEMPENSSAKVIAECQLHASLPPSDVIVSYKYSWIAEQKLHILLERVDGELYDPITESGPQGANADERFGWARALLSAVETIHAHGVAHRDISPWNCYYAKRGATLSLKLGDFGLAVRVPATGSSTSLSGMEEEGFAPLDESAIGSLYSAPELGAESGYDGTKVDIYSAGMTIFASWHAVVVARAKAAAATSGARGANIPRKQVQSQDPPRASGAKVAPAPAAVEPEAAAFCVDANWEEELTSSVEKLKAEAVLPPSWSEAGPMAELVLRMVSHDPQQRPSARECVQMLGNVNPEHTSTTVSTGTAPSKRPVASSSVRSWLGWMYGRRASTRSVVVPLGSGNV